ncbi:MAG: hypothetical protein P0Y59_04875 [Candidatus Sphingomonas phytovorans]|nr:hypothetical protein [Sphingomonas sp.]WEK01031.1 MAG: hypothetical protein P0Y59_04875 [Sphingomonas sp.]
MKFVSTIWAMALMLAAAAAPASATTFSPAPGTFLFQGTVLVAKGSPTFYCTLKLTISVTSSTTAVVTPALAAPSSVFCPTFIFSGTPYPFNYVSGGIEIPGVVMSTAFGTGCSGRLVGGWDIGSPASITFNATLPGSGSSDTCKIVGRVYQVAGSPLSITNP